MQQMKWQSDLFRATGMDDVPDCFPVWRRQKHRAVNEPGAGQRGRACGEQSHRVVGELSLGNELMLLLLRRCKPWERVAATAHCLLGLRPSVKEAGRDRVPLWPVGATAEVEAGGDVISQLRITC